MLLLSACGGEADRGGFGEAPAALPAGAPVPASTTPSPLLMKPARVRVAAPGGFRFEPQDLAVDAGSVVEIELENRDRQDHTLVVSELAIAMLAGEGQTIRSTVTIDRKNRGSFTFYCSLHRDEGMEGRIRVR